ncbi:ATP-dependent nuclease [Erysipelothrix rhusiopathiae]|uniref:ATP-dependent nuclease n=1 Tax=Erysipelothrix rhusiopathiae TaxID=1648 RepID=UPI0039E862AD
MIIEKVKLYNFRRFYETTEIYFNEKNNILVGDNGIGKSTIIEAILLTISGSISKVEKVGLERVMNSTAISEYLDKKESCLLPKTRVEVYLKTDDIKLYGLHNSERKLHSGVSMTMEPNDEFVKELDDFKNSTSMSFPFDYYKITFCTFQGSDYNQYSRIFSYTKFAFDALSNDYEIGKYIKKKYEDLLDDSSKSTLNHKYREALHTFTDAAHVNYPQLKGDISYHANTVGSSLLNHNLTLRVRNQDIWNLGKGEKLLTIISSAIESAKSNCLDFVFIEEPESHLTSRNTRELISELNSIQNCQSFVSTHDSMIASGIGLKSVNLVTEGGIISLNKLPDQTSKFFQKTTNNNLLNFVINQKVVLVEGNAEYIVMPELIDKITSTKEGGTTTEIISVDGLSFTRYLDIAKISNSKVAIITDNDGNYTRNINEKYREYINENIQVFSDTDNSINTFEVSIYRNNSTLLDEYLGSAQRYKGVQSYMLSNKTEASFELLELLRSNSDFKNKFIVPKYIEEAIKWIRR